MSKTIGTNLTKTRTGTEIAEDGTMFDIEVWEGTAAAVDSRFSVLSKSGTTRNGWNGMGLGKSQYDTGKSELVIRKPRTDNSFVEDIAQLIPNIVQKSIFEPPLPDYFSSVTTTDIKAIENALAKTDTDDPVFDNERAQHLYVLALKGVRHRIVWQPVLVRSRTYYRRADPSTFLGNYFDTVGCVLSTSAVILDAGLAGEPFPLPAYVSNDPDFVYGWLAGMPSVETGSNGTVVVSKRYEYGYFSAQLYTCIA